MFSPRTTHTHSSLLMLVLISLALGGGNEAVVAANASSSLASYQSDQNLVLGDPVERSIAGGDVHRYRIALSAGEFARIIVEQRGVAVVSAILTSNGEKLIEADNAGRESLSLFANAEPGQLLEYTVEVRARQQSAPAGKYTIRIEQQRAVRPQDQDRIAAEKLVWEGAQLSRRQQRESLRQAVEKYQAALPLWRTLQEKRDEALTLYLLALAEQDAGENQMALESYQQALDLSAAERDQERQYLVLNALGTLYFALGEPGKAIECYTQSLLFSQGQTDRMLETSLLANLGVAYKALGDNSSARDYYQRALLSARASGDQAMEAAVLTNLARLYDLMGDKTNSFATNQQVLSVWRALGNLDGEITTLKNLGGLAESEGRIKESLDYLNSALALCQTLGDSLREAYIRGDLARVARSGGALDDSRKQIEQTLTIIESMRGQLLNPDLRASFAAANRRYYEFYVDLLMQQPRASSERAGKPNPENTAAALRISESSHARTLSDLIAEARVDIRQGVDAELLERERTLAKTLAVKKAERMALVRKKASSAEIELLDREVLTHSAAYQQVEAEIKRSSPRYATLVHPEPVGLAEIQQRLLDPETLLLEYALGEQRSYLWVVSQTDLRSYTLPGRAVIEEQARQYYDRLTARGESVKFEKPEQKQTRIALADRELRRAASALSQTLFGQAAGLLGQKRLLVVGDGMLNYIPFGALPEPSAARRKVRTSHSAAQSETPLLVSHEVVNLPSASVLAELRRESPSRRKASSELAIIADPVFSQNDARFSLSRNRSLPPNSFPNSLSAGSASSNQASPDQANSLSLTDMLAVTLRTGGERDAQNLSRLAASRKEAEGIARFAPESRTLLALDFQAKRELVTGGQLSQYRLLHFATHGLLNSQVPELSGLVFSLVDENGQPQPGVLRLNDIYNLRLAADLVVLSACRTGLGKEVKGEGAIGLPRGFMYAGVPRIISSLWSVDDQATAELMTQFYREMLTGGKTAAAALRAAQVALWKENKWKAPYYWAGFILQGEPK